MVAKFALVAAAGARLRRARPASRMRTGLYLAQAGEFGFVLLALGASNQPAAPALDEPGAGAAMVLSMLATPLHGDVQQPHRDAAVGERLDDAVGAR